MNNYCNIHQVPMMMKRMNGGWTTVCPWCEVAGRYDKGTVRAGAHETHGYRFSAGDRRERGDVSSRETVIVGGI